jgi:predicted HD phosphohydrolase
VTVEFRRGLDDALVAAALREALGQVEARLAPDDQQAA